VGSWLRSSHLLKSEAKYPSATERLSDTKGMVLKPRERGCLAEVRGHPGDGKAESLFGVTAHHELTPNAKLSRAFGAPNETAGVNTSACMRGYTEG